MSIGFDQVRSRNSTVRGHAAHAAGSFGNGFITFLTLHEVCTTASPQLGSNRPAGLSAGLSRLSRTGADSKSGKASETGTVCEMLGWAEAFIHRLPTFALSGVRDESGCRHDRDLCQDACLGMAKVVNVTKGVAFEHLEKEVAKGRIATRLQISGAL